MTKRFGERNYEIAVKEAKGKTATVTIKVDGERYILCVYPMDSEEAKVMASLYISVDGEPYTVSSYEVTGESSIKLIKVFKQGRVLENDVIEDCLSKIHNVIAQ